MPGGGGAGIVDARVVRPGYGPEGQPTPFASYWEASRSTSYVLGLSGAGNFILTKKYSRQQYTFISMTPGD